MRKLLYMCTSLFLLWESFVGAESIGIPNQVALNQDVHFLAPNGDDLVVHSGVYEVEVAENWLRLIPGERTDAILIQTQTITHKEPLDSPRALSVPEGEDRHHLLLLFPDGHGMESVGTYSGIRPRGGFSFFSPTMRTLALNQPSSDTPSKPTVSTSPTPQAQLQIQPGPSLGGGLKIPPPPQQSTGKQVPAPPMLMNPPEGFEILGTAAPQKLFTWRPPASGPSISHYLFLLEDADDPTGHKIGPIQITASANTVATSQIISPRFYFGKRIRWSVQTCSHDGLCSVPATRLMVWGAGLPAPQLYSPEPGAVVTTLQPRLQWREVRAATYYLLCVSRPGVACPTRETPPGTNANSVVMKRIGSSNISGSPDLTQFFGDQLNWTVSACTSDGTCTTQQNVRPIKIAQAPRLKSGGITLRPSRFLEWDSNSDAPQFKLCMFTEGTACAPSGNLVDQDVTRNHGRLQTDIPFLNQLRSMAGKGVKWQVAACTPQKCLWSTPSSVYVPESIWRVVFSVRYIDLYHDCDDASPGDLKFSFRASISTVNGYTPETFVKNFDFGNYDNFESGTQIYVGEQFASLREAVPRDEIEVWGWAYDCDRASCGEEVVELLTTGRDDKLGEIPRRKWRSHRIGNSGPLGWMESDQWLQVDSRDTSCYGLAQGLKGTPHGQFDTTFQVVYEAQKTKIW